MNQRLFPGMVRWAALTALCLALVLCMVLTACISTLPALDTETNTDVQAQPTETEPATAAPDRAETNATETPTEAPTDEPTEAPTEADTVPYRDINFGFADPTQELWGTGGSPLWAEDNKERSMWGTTDVNPYSTAVNVAKINAAFGGNSARIWSHTDEICEPESLTTANYLKPGGIKVLQQVIDDYYNNGVTNIIYQTGVVNTLATRDFYNAEDQAWYSMWDWVGPRHKGGAAHKGLATLPGDDGSESGISYSDFLKLQREYFRQIALTLEHISYIEIMNEMECGMSLYRSYIQYGEVPPIEVSAQFAMDVCKMATEGIKLAGKEDEIKVLMPSLACVSGMADRYDTMAYLKAEYDYIKNHGMENNGSDDPDDYFQVVNFHPYVFLASGTSTTNYLYEVKGSKTVRQEPEVIEARWRAYVEGIRAVCIENDDEEKPFFITEVGMAGYPGGKGLDHPMWNDYKRNTLARQRMVSQIVYDLIQSMPYIDTVIFFRLGDYVPANTTNGYVAYGEASYGVIDPDGNLKDYGKTMYSILNRGSEDYSRVLAVLDEMKR